MQDFIQLMITSMELKGLDEFAASILFKCYFLQGLFQVL